MTVDCCSKAYPEIKEVSVAAKVHFVKLVCRAAYLWTEEHN